MGAMSKVDKILIVDDQPEIRELVKVTLEVADYQIFSAEHGQEAIDVAQAEHPDIILLDIKMPGSSVNGLEVCRRLKQDPITANIYIIIISASAQKKDLEFGDKVGADDYFIKPFSPAALIQKIEDVFVRIKPTTSKSHGNALRQSQQSRKKVADHRLYKKCVNTVS